MILNKFWSRICQRPSSTKLNEVQLEVVGVYLEVQRKLQERTLGKVEVINFRWIGRLLNLTRSKQLVKFYPFIRNNNRSDGGDILLLPNGD